MKRINISVNPVRVDMSRNGWRQLARVNKKLGIRFLRAFILRAEISHYLTMHEAMGIELDGSGQELTYENGICLLIRGDHGVWYITDIWQTETAAGYEPMFMWKKIRAGLRDVIAQKLIGWRAIFPPRSNAEYPAVCVTM